MVADGERGDSAGVREKRGAGAGWVTPSTETKDERARRCGNAGASDGVVIPGAVILGIDATDAPGDISDDIAASWIRTFASARGGPLHVVITRAADTNDLVFVAQHPPDSVRTLLHGWAIDRDRAERRAYVRLRDAALERVPDKLKPR